MLIILISILCIVLIVVAYEKSTNAMCESKKRLEGKTVIVTGGTAGMGLEIAKDLAERGARVIIACPFEEEGITAEKYLKKVTENENIVFKILNLGSLKSTREFAAEILSKEDRLDILVNNAGLAGPNKVSEDGLNFIMQVNYLGTYLLTLLLLPLLKKTGKLGEATRIINTASCFHITGKFNVEDWFNTKSTKITYYSNSKLCTVLFGHELTKKLTGFNVVVNTTDPGAVGTNIYQTYISYIAFIVKFFAKFIFKNAKQGAQTAIHLAVDKEAGKVSGQYYRNCRLSKSIGKGCDDEVAKVLWRESAKAVKLSDKEMEECLK